jgi:RNA polymerase sigma-70 factor, ECF subfamily
MVSPPEIAQHEEEKRWMRRAQHDPQAFAPLYERYFPRIYAYCWRRTRSTQDAEDLTSQIFAQALRALHTYRDGSTAAWLFTIARHAVIDHMRRGRDLTALDDLELSNDDDPVDAALILGDQIDHMRALVAQLDDDQRDLLRMRFTAGLNAGEIGRALGVSAGAVRVRLHTIIKRLRGALK